MKHTPPLPKDFDFAGFWQPRASVMRQWRMWNDHGIMPFEGGYYDQPPEWRYDMESCDAIYGYWVAHIRKEVKDRNG